VFRRGFDLLNILILAGILGLVAFMWVSRPNATEELCSDVSVLIDSAP